MSIVCHILQFEPFLDTYHSLKKKLAQLVWAVEYNDCISTKG